MDTADDRLRALARVVDAPDFVVPWLDRIYDPVEVDLVLALAAGPLPRAALAARLGLTTEDLAPVATRAYRRAVLAGNGEEVRADSFYERSAMWARSAGGGTVPVDVHKAIADWWLDAYVDSVREGLGKLRDGCPEPGGDADYAYLLLSEAEEMVRETDHIYLWRCDCRTLMRACDHSVNNCLRFHNDRDVGLEISKELAIDILREADAAGLTHCDYVGFGGPTDPHAICNCCTDCCQPHLASERLAVTDIWPRRRHLARLLPDECTLCGTCTERCPFGALTIEAGDGDERLVLSEAACRGCGLCATGCPEGAIEMGPRADALRPGAA